MVQSRVLFQHRRRAPFRVAASFKEMIPAVVLPVLVAACAATTESRDVILARQQLDDYLKQCTASHGYDPEATSGLGPYALGAGEREWRECVYRGLEKFLIPNTLSPEAYRKAIAEDREMTASVAGGTMTRAERRARVEALLEEIEQTEAKNKAKLEQTQSAHRLVQEEMRRQLDITRRGMIAPLGR